MTVGGIATHSCQLRPSFDLRCPTRQRARASLCPLSARPPQAPILPDSFRARPAPRARPDSRKPALGEVGCAGPKKSMAHAAQPTSGTCGAADFSRARRRSSRSVAGLARWSWRVATHTSPREDTVSTPSISTRRTYSRIDEERSCSPRLRPRRWRPSQSTGACRLWP